ncbi:DUF6005 family protein [Jeotgalibacillus sp. JSM ZJ347]|uniref:DUF6005 family protein n=1 Tax=Jeotgalibacillus sp. JSM ZJ347 TaxID=3342117 RepID=UPI0035A8795A
MIKVHCFVSCVCEAIKKSVHADHRPYYFGVWDADFDVLEDGTIIYHSSRIDHTFFRTWYEMLYGITLDEWYDPLKNKSDNIQHMLQLLDGKSDDEYLMVMLDLSKLPERENKFHQSPFPHYVMLEKTENEDEWMMLDPDFRWEGVLKKDRILDAIKEPAVGGGYLFDASDVIAPGPEAVEAYFNTCMKLHKNPILDAVKSIVTSYTEGQRGPVSNLSKVLKQLPVLAIRKYAYEHAYAYFWNELQLDEHIFEAWCDEIEKLERGFTTIQYRAMKYAKTEAPEVAETIFQKIEELQALEFNIKHGLQECFKAWMRKQTKEEVTAG